MGGGDGTGSGEQKGGNEKEKRFVSGGGMSHKRIKWVRKKHSMVKEKEERPRKADPFSKERCSKNQARSRP